MKQNKENTENTKSDYRPKLKIIGKDGNAFNLLGLARREAINNNMDWEKIKNEATSGDYNHLLQTLMKYFEVE